MAAVRGMGVAVMTRRSGSPVGALAAQRGPLLDAEAVLLVDHHAPERAERHLLGEQRVGAHDQADATVRPGLRARRRAPLPLTWLVSSSTRTSPAGHAPGALEVAQQRAHGGEVLLGQHLGRHHQRALVPALDGRQQCGHRHHRLARADVALEQAVHREGAGQVGDDHGERPPLGGRSAGTATRRGTGPPGSPTAPVISRGETSWCSARALPRRPGGAGPGPAAAGTARRRRAGGGPARTTSSDSGTWMAPKAAVRPHRPELFAPFRRATGRPAPRRRSSASSTKVADLPAGQVRLGRGRVDRQDAQRPAPRRHAGDDVDDRVDHLAGAPVLAHLAEEDRLGARLELLGPPRLVEEDDGQAAGARRARPRRPRRGPAPDATGARRLHRGQDGRLVAHDEVDTSAWRVRSM